MLKLFQTCMKLFFLLYTKDVFNNVDRKFQFSFVICKLFLSAARKYKHATSMANNEQITLINYFFVVNQRPDQCSPKQMTFIFNCTFPLVFFF